MKKLILLFSGFLLCLTSLNAQAQRKIQVAILFDTSNSMDGLIEQAKSRIWNIVNSLGTLSYQGTKPQIEIALYDYGNDAIKESTNYVRQILPLTGDLDMISQKLFSLSTNGGSEFCGAVISKSVFDLSWTNSSEDLKMIYIAGNEPFNQGPIDYIRAIKEARDKNIYVNTIYCGPYEQGIRELWNDGAIKGKGEFFNIDSDKNVVFYSSPYDDKINAYNDSLNNTYFGYGNEGRIRKDVQMTEDANAQTLSKSNKVERSVSKSKEYYSNSSWDLIDGLDNGNLKLDELKKEQLPENLREMSKEELQTFIADEKTKREKYQKEIGELAKMREKHIEEEKSKNIDAEADDLGAKINESISKKAIELNFEQSKEQ